jgi:hypothetical protein
MLMDYYSKMRLVIDGMGAVPLPRDALVFVTGVVVGFILRSLISARRRARARKGRHDFLQ